MKSYFRFLSRNKLYTLINIAGLVVSLMFIILMGDYTWRQYSIDSWHKNAERIYLMGNENYFFLWPQAAEGILRMAPDVEQTCCVLSQMGRIKYGNKEVKDGDGENGIIMLVLLSFNSLTFHWWRVTVRLPLMRQTNVLSQRDLPIVSLATRILSVSRCRLWVSAMCE